MDAATKRLLNRSRVKAEIEEFVRNYLKDAFIGKVDIVMTPIWTTVTIYTMRPGLVIGPRGKRIKALQTELEQRFKLENMQIVVSEVEAPELDPNIMAKRIAQAMAAGIRWRRIAFWALRRIMEAGARGAEIVISGKLTSARARSEKYTAGLIPKSGYYATKVRKGVAHVQLPAGIFGVKVLIYPPTEPLVEEVKVEGGEERVGA
ncbi:MAG: 30S ribosomal protein S3 [Aigarchaeota archaeon]|nr:30S ribosomal protein S3 [Aigarchaeota archaeon]MCS7126975.1 30S ribosomal protein S3 [Candidatus Calditenuaceae archaeon]MCX8202948.1 30S ribosomal protein S3 [Nitrososphaeria archaeon]MDW8043097.1 30S ribosomal protein S3 [Nitrososphaerota archaeon]